MDQLFCSDGLELNTFIRVDPAASWTTLIQVFLDMMPAKAANLRKKLNTRTC